MLFRPHLLAPPFHLPHELGVNFMKKRPPVQGAQPARLVELELLRRVHFQHVSQEISVRAAPEQLQPRRRHDDLRISERVDLGRVDLNLPLIFGN